MFDIAGGDDMPVLTLPRKNLMYVDENKIEIELPDIENKEKLSNQKPKGMKITQFIKKGNLFNIGGNAIIDSEDIYNG
jgi:hypothetical protein